MTHALADLTAPSLDDIGALAAAAFEALPAVFRDQCRGLVIRVAESADDATLEEMGIADPLDLTGLYQGMAMTERSIADSGTMPDEVWLYRRAILDEWAARGDVALGALVTHVLVHEIAHHFGWSDAEIAAIDDWRV